MNEKEFQEMVKKAIDAELEKTPKDMKLHVDMVMEKEGLRLNFTRTKKEE